MANHKIVALALALGLPSAFGCNCGARSIGKEGPTSGGTSGGLGQTDGGTGGTSGGTGVDAGCGLRTCASAHANCGPIGDGCGGVLECGSCEGPQTCGGGGSPSVCGGHAGCVPTTCAAAGARCGPLADGCGNLLQCGSCTAPESCGGSGIPSVCGVSGEADGGRLLPDGGCLPRSCAEQGVSCGPAGDGCGGTLSCGGCDAGSCGGGGPSICGTPASDCVPQSCPSLGFSCGPAGDGCGNLIQCGGCDGGSCGGGGVAGQCGTPPGCTPRSCAGMKATCGYLADGCGNVLPCGSCNLPDTCGGGGVPNVCGDGRSADGGSCNAPLASCNTSAGAVCTDLQSDSANCGQCGNACGASLICVSGVCTPQCAGQLACDADAGEVCVGDHCANACDVALTGTSSEGCEFWPLHLWNTSDGPGYFQGPLGIVASNTSTTATATVTLEDPAGVIATQTVAPGTAATFSVPNARDRLTQTQLGGAFHLRSTIPIAAYEYNPVNAAQAYTGSASLLLPTHTLSSSYFVVSYTYNAGINTSPPQGQGYLAVVGTQPNTQVTIQTPVATSASSNGAVAAIPAGGSLTLTLGQGDVVEVAESASLDDITGAKISADKPVAAFGGSGATTVPDTASGGDHFEAQLFPTAAWGTAYECEKYTKRSPNDADHWRIVGGVNGTTVTLSDPTIATIPTLAAGQVFEFETAESFDLTASQPVLVAHYLEAWGALSGQYDPAVFPDPTTNPCPFAGSQNDSQCIGDANMTLAIPTAQYLSNYTFYTPTSYAYDFVDVIAPMGSVILLDGAQIPALTAMGAGQYGLAQIRIQAGIHSMSGNQPFGITLYGYDYAISYTCVGGLDLKAIGFNGNPGSCTPLTCAQQSLGCGPAGDGCGGQIDGGCGSCPSPQTCGGAGTPGVCGAPCSPKTCSELGLGCGPAGDGCGDVIQCGGCDAGSCGGGGTRGVCGSPPPCAPKSCATLGYDCGPAGDGCGGLIDGGCGSCTGFEGTSPKSCGGGGVPGVCGTGGQCNPETCATLKLSCGPAGDGCGNVIQCGGCDAGSCGGGGTPGVCGAPPCIALTCAQLGYDCGPAGDGCGGLLQCGGCDAGSCGGGGQANICGSATFR
ncbi:MAG: hypothetical protein ACYCWW_08740 [Deltaproteobacteria bacterium]